MITKRVTRSQTLRDRITARNQQESPFLQLLPELRNIIYKYLLQGLQWVAPGLGYNHKAALSPALTILYICRQIHAEAAMLPFALSTFVIGNIKADDEGFPFLMGQPSAELALIRHLKFDHITRITSGTKYSFSVDDLEFLEKLSAICTLTLNTDGLDVTAFIKGDMVGLNLRNYWEKTKRSRHKDLRLMIRAWRPQARFKSKRHRHPR